MLKLFLQQLIQHQDLTPEQCDQAIELMVSGADPAQVGAFLALLQAKPISAVELFGLVRAMQQRMIPVIVNRPVLDIVGTGGDAAKTVNISTAASILAASCGAYVAKHGNRSVSSACGSADVLAALGIQIEMNAAQVAQCIEEIGIGFCFAPQFHPVMSALKSVRQALAIPTVFNMIGPLLNPARAQHYLLGVANPRDMRFIAEVLLKLGIKHGLVVHSAGLDELSLIGPATLIEITPAGLETLRLDPQDYGFKHSRLADIQGGSPEVNAKRLQAVFAGERSALADTIILNAGVALYAADVVPSIITGLDLARQHLQNGACQQLLQQWQLYLTSV